MSRLDDLYKQAARMATDEGVAIDAEPHGAIHQWAIKHCSMRPGTEFFIVNGIACAMADIAAQAEGYADQIDRAIHLMKQSKAYAGHKAKQERLASHGIYR